MGLIQLENMEFYAYHGYFKEEQIVGNKFIVNLTIETNTEKAEKSDLLHDTLNYHKAYNVVKTEMKKKSHLLENIASRILDALYDNFSTIQSATIKISKINPPMGGKLDCVSFTLTR
ncbi:MAG: dihydroneopterin aldolase [Bacteroidales bacterium]|nr:dihydroneopterin aldolase [Bacteroidales bacterium]